MILISNYIFIDNVTKVVCGAVRQVSKHKLILIKLILNCLEV